MPKWMRSGIHSSSFQRTANGSPFGPGTPGDRSPHLVSDLSQWCIAITCTGRSVIPPAPGDGMYRPNGRKDPAQGYVDLSRADQQIVDGRRTCFYDLSVHTFDVQTGLMSSLVEVHPTCSGDAGPQIP